MVLSMLNFMLLPVMIKVQVSFTEKVLSPYVIADTVIVLLVTFAEGSDKSSKVE